MGFMKVVGWSSGQKLLMLSGKRNMRNGPRDLQRGFPNGLVRDLARNLENLTLLMVRRREESLQWKLRRRKKKKKRRRKRRRRSMRSKLKVKSSPWTHE